MLRARSLVVAALVTGLLVGCAPTPRAPLVDAAASDPPAFSPDQDVPLLAPDTPASPTNPRLTATKTIGGGPDDASVDGRHRGTSPSSASPAQQQTRFVMAPRARGYYGGRVYSNPSAGYGASTASFTGNSAQPGVAGNYPTVPSYGSAPLR